MTQPLVSIVTPCHDREELLLERCIPSVSAQTHANLEHIIVVDRNPGLEQRLLALKDPRLRVVLINDLGRSSLAAISHGAWGWYYGTHMAQGEYLGFIGDDDEYRPWHVERHLEALTATGADYSLSKIDFHVGGEYVFTVGDGRLAITHLDANSIMARRSAFLKGNWVASGSLAPDFDLVYRWHRMGLRGAFVDEVTGTHHDGWLSDRPDIVEAARAGRDWRELVMVS